MSQILSFQSHSVRINVEGEQIWFVAKDVCEALGIPWNGRTTLQTIPDAWQGVSKLHTPSGKQALIIISEPAVYKLAFRSNKNEADTFTNWVVSEVLPSIRKTGKYEATPKVEQLALPDVSYDVMVRREAETLKQHLYAAGAASRKLYDIMNGDAATMGPGRRGRPGHTPEKYGLMDNLHRANETAFYALDNIAETIERNVRAMRRLALA